MAHKMIWKWKPSFMLPLTFNSQSKHVIRFHHHPFSPLKIHHPIINYTTAAAAANTSNNGDSVKAKEFLELTDEELVRQCEMDFLKSSGAGGQHRNKRESAVRLKHLPTGIIAQASEDRSQHMNRDSAVKRLRALIALKVEGSISEAAKYIGLSTGALSRLILSDDSLRKEVNDLRASKVRNMDSCILEAQNL
ncbi:hypothetical protein TanjilG_19990 [Lupinus angustifolius]|uniref:Prokaryotic-type class I peptide chain release factors domain-containing protein n=1 Tax=Lupinus angustifolius TaxID=3871 RepID=A0A394CBG3_LUPAN|nr:hypothetical protein TanjilG_23842 [Lupinus angustifolius]OIW07889.1 hypothetical protein TanjilG_19990 [Lupinus angustifolius]